MVNSIKIKISAEKFAEDNNSHCKCTALSKRQVLYILLVSVSGVTGIACAIIGYRKGSLSKPAFASLTGCSVAFIILGNLLEILRILYKRNMGLRRSLAIEKIRTYLKTIIEQDRRKNNNNENVERDPDATALPDYKPDSHCGLLVDKPTSSLRETEATQEHKTSVTTD